MSNVPWCRSNATPPGLRTPSRASAPGTFSRYQAKSSPPMLCTVSASASGPNAETIAARWMSTASVTLTTGGTPRV